VLATRATYVGSPEHKPAQSFAGPRRLRADASVCDPRLGGQEELTQWLRTALAAGRVGAPWEQAFPRYVWHVVDGITYEGRLVNCGLGQYKGYPLKRNERVEGL
jgi:hypothetical protein